jgi:hypothetical protein
MQKLEGKWRIENGETRKRNKEQNIGSDETRCLSDYGFG